MREQISVTDPLTERSVKTFFKQRWLQAIMRVAFAIGNVMAWIILSILYIVIITPYGLVFRLFRVDPLRSRRAKPAWHPLPSQYDALDQAANQ